MRKIISLAPGRTCLFGDHQDYLGLPVIACAISRRIKLTAVENGLQVFNINKPDIDQKRVIPINGDLENIEKGDHLLHTLKVLRRYNCIPDRGYDIEIKGNLPINAGTSSSSAVVVSWVNFLIEAFGIDTEVTPELISQLSYESEVLEQKAPGGKMDQYSIGLGNIVFIETGDDFSFEVINQPLQGIIIGESGIPKKTLGLLSELRTKARLSIEAVESKIKDFDIKTAKKEDMEKYLVHVPDDLKSYLYAAITNHDITQRALTEFRKPEPDFQRIGALMNEHHDILKNILKITVPRIDKMIEGALNAGAYGAKIVGSGGGGSIVVLAPEEKKNQVIEGIINAGGIAAYEVSVDSGARILESVGTD